MEQKLSLEDGKKLVKLARKSISYYCAVNSLCKESAPAKKFKEKRGVFVTLYSYPEEQLRGCIGLPYPKKQLWQAVINGAVSAAMSDPRFPSVNARELSEITVEVSVLTEPKEVKQSELPEKIEIGKHGIIIKRHNQSGLLLPQVAVEYNWDKETFLDQTSVKAGLYEGAWKLEDTSVELFSAQVFKEKKPAGKIVECTLTQT